MLSPSLHSGLCLEKVPAASPSLSNKNTGSPSSSRSTPDREQEIITCYEKSGDIALLYLQEAEKVFLSLQFFGWLVSELPVATSSHAVSHDHSPNISSAPGLPSALPSPWVCDE